MFRRMIGRSRRFRRSERGVISVLFAILLLPMLGLMAAAIDLSQFLVMKQQLGAAVDAAALDAGQSLTLSDNEATAEARAFIAANYPTLSRVGTLQSVSVTRTASSAVVTANASMTTSFLGIIGYKTLAVEVSAEVSMTRAKLEVVLVLGNGVTAIEGLKLASAALVNTLFASDPTLQYVRIAVVPFSAAVNVGTQYESASWLDAGGAGALTRENLDLPKEKGLIWLASKLTNANWGGCVRARAEPFDVQETAPAASTPETLYTPYFAPSEPNGSYNHYLPDGSFPASATLAQKQYSITKYANGYVSNLPDNGPNFSCEVQPIIRLTNNQAAILDGIDAMSPSGATVIPVGLMWGWHLLSPNGPFGDGAPYSDPNTIKAIILATDGQNDVQNGQSTSPTNGFDQSYYSAYGYLSGPHLNIYALPISLYGIEDQAAYNLDLKEIQLCNAIKAVTDASGNPGRIKIYTVGFGNAINSRGLSLLQQCASSPSNFFYNPTSETLTETFQNIAAGLSQLRVSR